MDDLSDLFDYTGYTVVLTGAASGIGAATCRALLNAGAAVHTVDLAEVRDGVTAAHRCDLGDPAAIADVAQELPARFDTLMNCAGVPGGTRFGPAEVMRINFLGLRALTEALMERLEPDGSVVHVASVAGVRWRQNAAALRELIATEDFAAGTAWCEDHPDLLSDGYSFSKEAVQYYTMARSASTSRRGVRMNSLCPGVTDTPILPDFREAMGDDIIDLVVNAGRGAWHSPRRWRRPCCSWVTARPRATSTAST